MNKQDEQDSTWSETYYKRYDNAHKKRTPRKNLKSVLGKAVGAVLDAISFIVGVVFDAISFIWDLLSWILG